MKMTKALYFFHMVKSNKHPPSPLYLSLSRSSSDDSDVLFLIGGWLGTMKLNGCDKDKSHWPILEWIQMVSRNLA